MRSHLFKVSTDLAAPVETVFRFFSVAENLNLLTPPHLKFEILTPSPIVMGQGTVIDYRIRLRGVPMDWRTEITAWEPGRSFTDTQLRGPYKKWVHTHTFEPVEGGTRMTDLVEYELPLGFLGALVHPLVRRDIERIFVYRSRAVSEAFPLL